MKQKTAMLVALGVSIVGMFFSGFLSYRELFLNSCDLGFVRCGGGNIDLGLPACVYGLMMYTVLVIVLGLGLKRK